MARKNGKSTFLSGLMLYHLIGDGEPGARCYSAATKRDQAKAVFDEAVSMVRKSSVISKIVKVFKDTLAVESTGSQAKPLGANYDTLDSLNISFCVIDELHAHRNRKLYEVLDTATGSREQPLMISITTAGRNRTSNSICWQKHQYTISLLEGIETGEYTDDSFFGLICTLDKGDDWQNVQNWGKANPNLTVSCSVDDIARKVKEAVISESGMAEIKQKHMNMWVESEQTWINRATWAASAGTVVYEELLGKECYLGIDLAPRWDLTALSLVFPWENDVFKILPYFFMPKGTLQKHIKKDRYDYQKDVDSGLLTLTEGDRLDYHVVENFVINDLSNKFYIKEIAIDPAGASQMMQTFAVHGLNYFAFKQYPRFYTAAIKEMERLTLDGKIHHGGHPLLAFNMSNTAIRTNSWGDMIPIKDESKRNDGIIATLQALSRAIVVDPGTDIYWGV